MDYVVGKDSCDYPITIIVPFNKRLTSQPKSPSQIPERAIEVIQDYVAALRFPFLRGPSSTDEAQRA